MVMQAEEGGWRCGQKAQKTAMQRWGEYDTD
jgi:hypothetical protein